MKYPKTPSLEELSMDLHSGDAPTRSYAALRLGFLADLGAVDNLIRALSDTDIMVQQAALLALCWLGGDQAFDAVRAWAFDSQKDPLMRRVAFENMALFGDAAFEPLFLAYLHFSAQIVDNTQREAWLCSTIAYALGYLGNEGALPALIAALNHSNFIIRGSAADALGWLGHTQAIEPLIGRLKVDNELIVNTAATALASIADPSAIEPLILSLSRPDLTSTSSLEEALIKFGSRAVDPLITYLVKSENRGISQIIEILGEIGDSRAFLPLWGLFDNADATIRNAVVLALGKLGDVRAVEPLLHAVNDADENVAISAILALGGLQKSEAVLPLITLCQILGDDRRFFAIRALGLLKDARCIPVLLSLLQNGFVGDRSVLIEAFGLIGDRRATEWIHPFLADPELRLGAIHALGHLRDPRAVNALVPLLAEDDSAIREAAFHALAEIDDTRALEVIIAGLEDDDIGIRYRAAIKLAESGDNRVFPILLEALNQTQPYWVHAAVRALGVLGDPRACEPLFTLAVKQPLTRLAVARALYDLGDGGSLKLLTMLLRTVMNSTHRGLAAEALGDIGDITVLPFLEFAKHDHGTYFNNEIESQNDPGGLRRVKMVYESAVRAIELIKSREAFKEKGPQEKRSEN